MPDFGRAGKFFRFIKFVPTGHVLHSKNQRMVTLKRLGIYLVIFFVTVSLLIVFVNFRRLDNHLVNEANKAGIAGYELNKEIVLINLEAKKTGSDGADTKQFRLNIISLLNTIAAESKNKKGPKGVLLDLWFSNDSTEIEPLKAALKGLKDLNVPVYASYNVNEKHERLDVDSIDFGAVEPRHRTEIYTYLLAGSGQKHTGSGRYHTLFYPEQDVANYENDIRLFYSLKQDSVLIESLVRKVAMDLNAAGTMSHAPKRVGSVVPYRSLSGMEKLTYTFVPGNDQSPGTFATATTENAVLDMDKNILVVGDMTNDRVDIDSQTQIPGPYIVAWALSDLLDNNTGLKLPIENLSLIVGQILFFSFFSVLIYSLLFKYLKRLQTKPAVIALVSFAVTLLFFYAYFRVVLGFNYVIPASHTLVATCVACILSCRFAHKFLVTGVAEGSQKYDVFISYSRSQSAWVNKNVYEPLAAYTRPDGGKLNIFYDKKSIGIGEMFTTKYMWAIVDTRCFIPVFSDDYYSKNHCRNEMDCAVKRKVEKLLYIRGIALSIEAVPEAFNGYNCVDATTTPGFIQIIEAELSEQYAVASSGSLTVEETQNAVHQGGAVSAEKEAEPHVKEESIPQNKVVLVEKERESHLKDGLLLKHYCLEKAIEVYKCNQSMTVVELAEQFERYLKSHQTENIVSDPLALK